MNETSRLTPPYVSYRTFANYLDKLKENGIPHKLDPSVMRTLSGASQSQLRGAFRYLGLIDSNDATTNSLHVLVNADETELKELWAQLVKISYTFLFGSDADFDLSRATPKQFADKFREQGLNGDTIRKAQAFFLNLADLAGIQVAKHIRDGRTAISVDKSRKNPVRTINKPTTANKQTSLEERTPAQSSSTRDKDYAEEWRQMMLQSLLDKYPEFNPEWDTETRQKWFDGITEFRRSIDNLDKRRPTSVQDEEVKE